MKGKNFLFVTFITIVSCIMLNLNAFAANTDMLRYINIGNISTKLTFDGGLALCSGNISGKADTQKITATVTLYKNVNGKLTALKTWSGLETSQKSLTFSDSYYVSRDYTYRLKVETTVSNGKTSETASSYVDSYCP